MSRRPIPGPLLWLGIIVIIMGAFTLLVRGFGGLDTGSVYAVTAIFDGILFMAIGVGVLMRKRWSLYVGLVVFTGVVALGSYLTLAGLLWWSIDVVVAVGALLVLLMHREEFRRPQRVSKDYSRSYGGRFSR